MWKTLQTDEFDRRFKRYEKKAPRELQAVLDNLDLFLEALKAGVKPKPPAFGFLHVEPSDVLAIDQKGGGNKLAQTRLYVYPDTTAKTLYLLTLGDKTSQREDIKNCKAFVEHIKTHSKQEDIENG